MLGGGARLDVVDQHVERLCGELPGPAHAAEGVGPVQLDLALARLAARHVEIGHDGVCDARSAAMVSPFSGNLVQIEGGATRARSRGCRRARAAAQEPRCSRRFAVPTVVPSALGLSSQASRRLDAPCAISGRQRQARDGSADGPAQKEGPFSPVWGFALSLASTRSRRASSCLILAGRSSRREALRRPAQGEPDTREEVDILDPGRVLRLSHLLRAARLPVGPGCRWIGCRECVSPASAPGYGPWDAKAAPCPRRKGRARPAGVAPDWVPPWYAP